MPLIERHTVFEYNELISLWNIQSNLFLRNLIGTNISETYVIQKQANLFMEYYLVKRQAKYRII
jgi:hypothetical protein